MYRITILAFFTVICSCNTTPNIITKESFSQNANSPKFNFIGQDLRSGIEGDLEYETLQVLSIDLNKDKLNDTLLIERIVKLTLKSGQIHEWDEVGDFHRISISISGRETKTFVNIDGWVEVERLSRYEANLWRENKVNSNNILVLFADSTNALILLAGYPYASKPGLLTILNIFRGETPHLIFNENVELYGFKDFDKNGTKDLITTVWDGFYKDAERNKYRHNVYLLNGGLTHSPEYSKIFCDEFN